MARRASTPVILIVNPDGTVSAKFTGDVEATHFYAPSATAHPRIEIDSAGFRSILADGSEGARIVADTPRPIFQYALGGVIGSVARGTLAATGPGGSAMIDTGGDILWSVDVHVPAGTSLQGFIGNTFWSTPTNNMTAALQAVEPGRVALGPAIQQFIPSTTGAASTGGGIVAPFNIINPGDHTILALGCSIEVPNAGSTLRTPLPSGFIQAIYG